MRIFYLVIKDLFWFVIGLSDKNTSLSTSVLIHPQAITPQEKASKALPASSQNKSWISSETIILPPRTSESPKSALNEPTVMYITEPAGAWCLAHAYESFDNSFENFPYGTAVTVISFQGRYARVWRKDSEGWVLKDALTPDKSSVWPILIPDMSYESDTADTKKIRILIQDIFTAGRLALPLQAGEYILYRLLSDNRQIIWPEERPRLPGSWQRILKGVNRIHMSISPKTDSIMEWLDEDGEGHLAYIDSVSPDKTLMLAAVGLHEPGIFTESIMTESTWRELRPVFIEVG
jgi:hypothetical protein